MITYKSNTAHPAPGVTFETGTIVHEGREFSAGGAEVTPEHLFAYLGAGCSNYGRVRSSRSSRTEVCTERSGPVTTWQGETIGRYTLKSSREQWGTRVYYVRITLTGGAIYYGRSQGSGKCVNAKRKASQLKEGTR